MELRLLKKVENLSLGPQGSCPLAPTTRFAVPLTLSKQRKLVFEVADGVTTPEAVLVIGIELLKDHVSLLRFQILEVRL